MKILLLSVLTVAMIGVMVPSVFASEHSVKTPEHIEEERKKKNCLNESEYYTWEDGKCIKKPAWFTYNKVPDWVKNTAGWWATDKIQDSEFLNAVEFLIKHNIIQISETSQSNSVTSNTIPEWIKNTAGWWADGSISDKNFLDGIKFLVENGIINTGADLEVLESIDDISNTVPSVFTKLHQSYSWDKYYVNEDSKNKQTIEFWKDGLIAIGGVSMENYSGYQTEKEYLAKRSTMELLKPQEIILDYPEIRCYHLFERTPPTDMIGYEMNAISDYACYMLNVQAGSVMALSDEINSFNYVELQKQVVYVTLENILEKNGVDANLANLGKLQKPSQNRLPDSNPDVNSTTEGFSSLSCRQTEYGFVIMTGRYTNGPIAYSDIYFTLGIEDENGTIVSTGIGNISNLGAYQTKIFEASAGWKYDFANCIIEVDNAFE